MECVDFFIFADLNWKRTPGDGIERDGIERVETLPQRVGYANILHVGQFGEIQSADIGTIDVGEIRLLLHGGPGENHASCQKQEQKDRYDQ